MNMFLCPLDQPQYSNSIVLRGGGSWSSSSSSSDEEYGGAEHRYVNDISLIRQFKNKNIRLTTMYKTVNLVPSSKQTTVLFCTDARNYKLNDKLSKVNILNGIMSKEAILTITSRTDISLLKYKKPIKKQMCFLITQYP